MLRFRRYRVFLVFAVILTILVVRMVRNGEWDIPRASSLDFKPLAPASGPEKAVPDNTYKNGAGKGDKVETLAEKAQSTTTRIPTAVQQKPTGLGEKAKPDSAAAKQQHDEGIDEEALGAVVNTPAATKTPAPSPTFESVPKVSLPDRKPSSAKDDSSVEEIHAGSPGRQSLPVFSAAPTTIHWERQKEHFPVPTESIIHLPTGQPKAIPKIQYPFSDENPETKAKRVKRQEKVRAEFKQAWEGYSTHAWLHDELKPVSGSFRDPFCGWSATLVDAMDTLWIMGLYEEFEAAVAGLQQIDFTTSSRSDIPMFETTIRYLGGLLAAYDVSGGKYKVILDKAIELADVMIGAFDTPNRMPVLYYNWKPAYASQPHRASSHSNLAELGSMSMEFTRLAQLTREPRYYDAVARVTNALEDFQNRGTPLDGVFPESIDASGCNRSVVVTKPIGVSVNKMTTPTETVGYEPDKDEDKPTAKEGESSKESKKPTTPGEMPEAEKASQAAEDKSKESEQKIVARQLDYGSSSNSNSKKDDEDEEEQAAETETDQDAKISKDASVKDTKSSTEKPTTKVKQKAEDKVPEQKLDECAPQGLESASGGADKFSMGGSQDSTYEYFTKQYLLLGGHEEKYHTMYIKTMNAVRKWMIYRPMLPDNNDILFSGQITTGYGGANPKLNAEVTHLTCFLGGMVGMGAKVFGLEDDMELAKKLTDGCVWAYDVTPTGIMPEFSTMVPCEDRNDCTWNQTAYYLALDPQGENRDKQVQKYLEDLEFRKVEEKKARIEAVEQAEKDLSAAQAALKAAKEALAAAEAAEAADEEDTEEEEEDQTEDQTEEPENNTKQEPKEKAVDNKEQPEEKQDDEKRESEPLTDDDIHDKASTKKAKTTDETGASSGKAYAKRDMELSGTTEDASEVEKSSEDVKPTTVDKSEEPTKTKSKGKGKGKGKIPATLAPDPMRPLTHKEYVEQRLNQSALPPGFFNIHDRRYILRNPLTPIHSPEAIESVWYMYRITGDPTWQDKGWQMFESVIAATKAEYGHSAINDVTLQYGGAVAQMDQMESFWLAETLKYFYLLYCTPDVINLDEWVLNTEAHPFKRPAS
ncbi:glycosyl hydrolase family 47-domain-containing protein [Xylogone sp. PMI_703]|nr:glycosyl hydrolase family 47-domain-containing protein [Xylogone sp. PMI_703]